MKKNESPESRYRKIGPIYIRKGVLLLLIAAAAIAVLAKFGFPTGLIRYPHLCGAGFGGCVGGAGVFPAG